MVPKAKKSATVSVLDRDKSPTNPLSVIYIVSVRGPSPMFNINTLGGDMHLSAMHINVSQIQCRWKQRLPRARSRYMLLHVYRQANYKYTGKNKKKILCWWYPHRKWLKRKGNKYMMIYDNIKIVCQKKNMGTCAILPDFVEHCAHRQTHQPPSPPLPSPPHPHPAQDNNNNTCTTWGLQLQLTIVAKVALAAVEARPLDYLMRGVVGEVKYPGSSTNRWILPVSGKIPVLVTPLVHRNEKFCTQTVAQVWALHPLYNSPSTSTNTTKQTSGYIKHLEWNVRITFSTIKDEFHCTRTWISDFNMITLPSTNSWTVIIKWNIQKHTYGKMQAIWGLRNSFQHEENYFACSVFLWEITSYLNPHGMG